MTDEIHCERCDETVSLCRTERRKLAVECGCKSRYTKVKSILPEVWTDE